MTASDLRILGIDFSGAADAGRKIWIAEGVARNGAFELRDLRQACTLDGGGVAPGMAISALVRHILREPRTVAGCDFPFTLPRSLIDKPTWVDFVAAFPGRFADADSFRAWALHKAHGRELRRDADRAAATPFNSYNLRIYRQTWWGIVALLHPLVTSGAAIAVPYQPRTRRPLPILIEACPACSLKSIGIYSPYKGRTAAHRRNRRAILTHLVSQRFLTTPPAKMMRLMIDDIGGDALDAVIAALATSTADLRRDVAQDEMLDGRIYWQVNRPS